MKLIRSFPMLAFTLVLLSIAGICTAQKSLGLFLVAGTLAAISWYITEGPRGRTLPRWVSNVLVIAVSLNVFVDMLQHRDDVLGVLGRFAVWLTLIKLYERRTARDYAHLLTLSLLLMMTASLQSSDLLFGLMLLAYAALGLYVLLLHQLFAAFERAREQQHALIPADYRLIPPLKPISGAHVGLRFRAQAVGMGVAGVVISALVFVVFPRDVGAGMFGMMHASTGARTTKFSSEIDLRQGGRISSSRARVLTLQVTDHRGDRVRLDGPVRLRGAILNSYNGRGQWAARPLQDFERVIGGEPDFIPLGPNVSDDDAAHTLRIILAGAVDGVQPVFSTYLPVAVECEPDVSFLYKPRTQTLRTSDTVRRLSSYAVKVQDSPSDELLAGLADRVRPVSRAAWFSPGDYDILRRLADEHLEQAGVPKDRPDTEAEVWKWNAKVAAALAAWLQSGEFVYTTDLSGIVYPSVDADPIVQFLTNAKRGHCEFFASALAALCQSKGIPSRVAVGYIAYDFDESQREYNVRESNAHAWTEIATGERRWTTFDPTPPATLQAIHSTPTTIADQMRWVYQRFEGNWSSTIVNFDGSAQTQLADTFNRSWTRRIAASLDSVREWMAEVNAFFNVGPGGYIWMGIVASALIIAVIALVKLMRRTRAIRRTLQLEHLRGSDYQRMLRQLGFYLDMLGVLRRGGIAKPAWQPPLQFAQELGSRHRQAAGLVQDITDVFYRGRYGGQELEPEVIQGARERVRQLAEALRVRV